MTICSELHRFSLSDNDLTKLTCDLVFPATLEELGLSSVSVTEGITLVSEEEARGSWRDLNISKALSILGVITSVVLVSYEIQYEPPHQNTKNLHMRKQRHRSASQELRS